MKHYRLMAIIAAGMLLAACGGGGGGGGDVTASAPDPDARAEMPASAGASVQAFHTTVAGLTADDRANPLSLDQVLAPTSDSAEPTALD
jgi:hypothetical protein